MMNLTRFSTIVVAFILGASAGVYASYLVVREAAKKETSVAIVRDAITFKVSKLAEQHQEKIRVVTQIITKQVVKYATKKTDAHFPIPVAFVLLHDEAAGGHVLPIPVSAGGIDDTASDVKMSEVSGTTVYNYGECQAIRQQLIDLQNWITEQHSENGEMGDGQIN